MPCAEFRGEKPIGCITINTIDGVVVLSLFQWLAVLVFKVFPAVTSSAPKKVCHGTYKKDPPYRFQGNTTLDLLPT